MESNSTPSRSDIDDILKRKRKIREHKACYPCRQRKVKCDSNVPCKTCIERNHADICAFNPPPSKRQDTGATHNGLNGIGATLTIGRDDWDRLCSKLNAMERSFTELKDDLRHVSGRRRSADDADGGSPTQVKEESSEPDGPRYVRAMEVNEQSHLTGERVHLGGGSVPALVLALRKVNGNTTAVNEVLGTSVLPLFGLDNETATYPFVDLWGQPRGTYDRISELCKALPSDSECLESFRLYRDFAHVVYPAIAELDQFESDLLVFLARRRSSPHSFEHDGIHSVYGKSIQWLGLLFAAFASGAQFSVRPKKERDPVAQVYVCCSFECLRLVNYISNASSEVIQSMLILGNVLANAMNAGAAWSLLGMTIRLAQSLGLHRTPENTTPTAQDIAGNKIWWAVLWQDSLLSISYDRASSAATADCPVPKTAGSEKTGYTYHESMYRILKVGLDTIRNRVAPQRIESRLSRCGDLRDEVQKTRDAAAGHLRDLGSCRSIREQSEYWMLYLHASFMKSELCRPAVSPSTAVFDESNKLRRLCIENLMNTVEAFLGIASIAPVYTRSWAVTHRALSSALLLGILGEPLRTPRAQTLLSDFIEAMTATIPGTDGVELTAPIQRSLSALRKLSALESRTPKQLEPADANSNMSATDGSDGMTNAPSSANAFDYAASSANISSFNFDDTSFWVPSPLSGFEDESSPYALMDSIIWGGGQGRSLA